MDQTATAAEATLAPSLEVTPARLPGERLVIEYLAALGKENSLNRFAGSLPFGLNALVWFPMYMLRLLHPTRFQLTNRRLCQVVGLSRWPVQQFFLEDIAEVRLDEVETFTRTGDLQVIGAKGEMLMTLSGIQDPQSARQTILDTVVARKAVQAVLAEHAKG